MTIHNMQNLESFYSLMCVCKIRNFKFLFYEFFPRFDNLSTQFVFHGIEYELSLWDTSGAPERKKLRCLSYQDV